MLRLITTLALVTLLLTSVPVQAFPGDERDERCAELLAAGIVTEDCLPDTGLSALELRAAQANMELYPAPDVVPVEYQERIVWERSYRRLLSPAVIYDAPNGNPIRTWDAGYNFVTVISSEGDWVQINYGEWVEAESIDWADVSEFAGAEIHNTLKRPFAWMLAEAYPSSYPGGEQNRDAEMIDRYTMMNIYGVEFVDGWEWYLVGPDQWVQQIRVAKVQPTPRPEGVGPDDFWVAVDLYEQTAVAYEGDRMVFATLISSGLPQWDTNLGLFNIYERYAATKMSGAEGQVDFYFIEEVPYVMYYDGEISLHGTYWHDRFGYRQSHGCVNLSIMDAWWIYQWTEAQPEAWVYVFSSGEYRSDLPNWARR